MTKDASEIERLRADNSRLRALLAGVVKYWEMRDPNAGRALESAIKAAKHELADSPSFSV